MRPIAALLVVLVAVALCAAPLPITVLPADFLRGERPSAWPEGLTVLECWARWCGPCVRAMPHLEALHRELRDERVRIVGVNVWDKGTDAEIRAFLAKQPTPPTYAIAVDRAGALPKTLGIKGIPHAVAVRGGEIVWQGHPNALTAEKLRALRDGRPERAEADKPDPMATLRDLEARADAAAAKGDWAAAADLQRQTFHSLPGLPAGYRETAADWAMPPLPPYAAPAAAQTIAGGDAAPYAALVGPLPADDVPTLVAYWPNPFWIAKLTWATLAMLPERCIAKALPYPHRTLTLAPAKARPHLENLLAPLAWRKAPLAFAKEVDAARFGVSDRHNPPYVAYFRGGRLLWKGPLETLPAALRAKNPPADPESVRAAVADETARTEALSAAFGRLVKATAPADRAKALAEVEAVRPLPRGWGALLMPHFLNDAYRAKDVPAGLARVRALHARFRDDAGALEMLRKVIDAWPELALEAAAEQSVLAERLGELNDRDDPAYAQAWFNVAAEDAARAGDPTRAAALRQRACLASPTACRLRQFLHRLPALPAH